MSDAVNSTPLNKWTPLTCLPSQSLTPSGLLLLDREDGEVELLSRSSIELRSLSSDPSQYRGLLKPAYLAENNPHAQWTDRHENLTLTLTTHRIVFQTSSRHSHFLHLSNIQTHKESGGNWTTNRSYKVDLDSSTFGPNCLVFRLGKNDRDDFYKSLSKACKRRQWEESSRLEERKKNSVVSQVTQQKVGIDAIMTKNRMKHSHAAKLAESAFASSGNGGSGGKKSSSKESVETLLREAGELVGVIQKYVATLEQSEKKKNASSKGDGDNDNDEKDRKELTNMLEDMGMITALSSSQTTSVSQYHEILARQISDFLKKSSKFGNSGGIMTLTDVYCLFNRARGTNMISPEELIEALKRMEGLGLGMRLREFEESGVLVLQDCDFDDEVMIEKIIDHIQQENSQQTGNTYNGVTVLEASRILKISALLANEQLRSAERKGVLCRDVTLEGTRFFQNEFDNL